MNRVNKSDEYGVKWVPDIFICNEEGEVLYYSRFAYKVKFTPLASQSEWRCEFENSLGNIEDWYNIQISKIPSYVFYFRSFKRNKNTGEDEPLCFAIVPNLIIPHSFSFEADSEPFNFPITFNFNSESLFWISDKDCPSYEVIYNEDKDNPRSYNLTFSKPERPLKQIKVEQVKERLIELRGKQNEN